MEKISEYIFDTYIFGVECSEIDTDNQKMIERHVLWLHRKPKVLLLLFLAALAFVFIFTLFGLQTR